MFVFFKAKKAYGVVRRFVGSGMVIRGRGGNFCPPPLGLRERSINPTGG